jgi:hypothetical protein
MHERVRSDHHAHVRFPITRRGARRSAR